MKAPAIVRCEYQQFIPAGDIVEREGGGVHLQTRDNHLGDAFFSIWTYGREPTVKEQLVSMYGEGATVPVCTNPDVKIPFRVPNPSRICGVGSPDDCSGCKLIEASGGTVVQM